MGFLWVGLTSHLKPQGKKHALLGRRKAAPFNSNVMFLKSKLGEKDESKCR